MKKIAAALFGLTLAAVPLFASAGTLEDLELQIRSLLTTVAVLQAAESGASSACAVVASKTSVAVNEPFLLMWGSYGGTDPSANHWPPTGVFTIKLDKPVKKKYTLDFYGSDGATSSCSVVVSVHK